MSGVIESLMTPQKVLPQVGDSLPTSSYTPAAPISRENSLQSGVSHSRLSVASTGSGFGGRVTFKCSTGNTPNRSVSESGQFVGKLPSPCNPTAARASSSQITYSAPRSQPWSGGQQYHFPARSASEVLPSAGNNVSNVLLPLAPSTYAYSVHPYLQNYTATNSNVNRSATYAQPYANAFSGYQLNQNAARTYSANDVGANSSPMPYRMAVPQNIPHQQPTFDSLAASQRNFGPMVTIKTQQTPITCDVVQSDVVKIEETVLEEGDILNDGEGDVLSKLEGLQQLDEKGLEAFREIGSCSADDDFGGELSLPEISTPEEDGEDEMDEEGSFDSGQQDSSCELSEDEAAEEVVETENVFEEEVEQIVERCVQQVVEQCVRAVVVSDLDRIDHAEQVKQQQNKPQERTERIQEERKRLHFPEIDTLDSDESVEGFQMEEEELIQGRRDSCGSGSSDGVIVHPPSTPYDFPNTPYSPNDVSNARRGGDTPVLASSHLPKFPKFQDDDILEDGYAEECHDDDIEDGDSDDIIDEHGVISDEFEEILVDHGAPQLGPVSNVQAYVPEGDDEEQGAVSAPSSFGVTQMTPHAQPDVFSVAMRELDYNAFPWQQVPPSIRAAFQWIAATPIPDFVEDEFEPFLPQRVGPTYHLDGRLAAPFEDTREYTLVLDMDETLMHCSGELLVDKAGVARRPSLNIHFDDTDSWGRMYIRPFAKSFLDIVSKVFEVVVLTASTQSYADHVMDELDPDGTTIHHRLLKKNNLENISGT